MRRFSSVKSFLSIALLAGCIGFSFAARGSDDPGVDRQGQVLLNPQAPAEQRLRAAQALGRSEDPRALDALVGVLDKSGEGLRDSVIEILQKGKGVDILAQRALDGSLSTEERVLAVRGLRVMRHPTGFPALKQLLSSPIDSLRLEAAWALSMAGAATAEPELIRALGDPNKDVRYYVADALGSVKSPAAKAALENRKKTETDPAVLQALRQGTR